MLISWAFEINLLSSVQEELAQLKELLNGAYEIQPGIVKYYSIYYQKK